MSHQLLVVGIILHILITINALGLALHTQDSDGLNTNTGVVLERTRHTKLTILINEVNLRHGILHNRLAVIKIQGALGAAIQSRRNNNVEALLAQSGGGVCALDTLRIDNATLIVDGDVCVVDVVEGDVFALSADGLAGAPFVEDVVGEVEGDARAVLLCDGGDEDSVTVEELEVDGVGVGIIGVVEEQGVESGCAGLVLLVDSCVDVVNWKVLLVKSQIGCLRRGWTGV